MKVTVSIPSGIESRSRKAEDLSHHVNEQATGCDCCSKLRGRIAELDKELAYLKAENEFLTSATAGWF